MNQSLMTHRSPIRTLAAALALASFVIVGTVVAPAAPASACSILLPFSADLADISGMSLRDLNRADSALALAHADYQRHSGESEPWSDIVGAWSQRSIADVGPSNSFTRGAVLVHTESWGEVSGDVAPVVVREPEPADECGATDAPEEGTQVVRLATADGGSIGLRIDDTDPTDVLTGLFGDPVAIDRNQAAETEALTQLGISRATAVPWLALVGLTGASIVGVALVVRSKRRR